MHVWGCMCGGRCLTAARMAVGAEERAQRVLAPSKATALEVELTSVKMQLRYWDLACGCSRQILRMSSRQRSWKPSEVLVMLPATDARKAIALSWSQFISMMKALRLAEGLDSALMKLSTSSGPSGIRSGKDEYTVYTARTAREEEGVLSFSCGGQALAGWRVGGRGRRGVPAFFLTYEWRCSRLAVIQGMSDSSTSA